MASESGGWSQHGAVIYQQEKRCSFTTKTAPTTGKRSNPARPSVPRTHFHRLHELLANLWWRMRQLFFEEKPKPKSKPRKRAGRSQAQTDSQAQAASQRQTRAPSDSYSAGDEASQVSYADCLLPSVSCRVFNPFPLLTLPPSGRNISVRTRRNFSVRIRRKQHSCPD